MEIRARKKQSKEVRQIVRRTAGGMCMRRHPIKENTCDKHLKIFNSYSIYSHCCSPQVGLDEQKMSCAQCCGRPFYSCSKSSEESAWHKVRLVQVVETAVDTSSHRSSSASNITLCAGPRRVGAIAGAQKISFKREETQPQARQSRNASIHPKCVTIKPSICSAAQRLAGFVKRSLLIWLVVAFG